MLPNEYKAMNNYTFMALVKRYTFTVLRPTDVAPDRTFAEILHMRFATE
ncbi:MAG: hypothetical protein ACMG6E_01290 [Candidatus Roizmanbacteria bacterium]